MLLGPWQPNMCQGLDNHFLNTVPQWHCCWYELKTSTMADSTPPPTRTVTQQTLGWAKHGSKGKVVDGALVAGPSEFEVRGGLLGTDFQHTLFGRPHTAAPEARPASRRLLAAGAEGPAPFEPAWDSAGHEAGAGHLLRRAPCPGRRLSSGVAGEAGRVAAFCRCPLNLGAKALVRASSALPCGVAPC